ncbi:TPA: LysR family transcriptional regulator [Serratia marcescens]|jgi:LysR family carnitine catabolism transcriptional activator|nr:MULTISPECIES: LysR family transcriptional regulator [Serratia]ALE99043.1 LysR-family transcriptional regulator [Serratia marcescens]ASM10050.1 LysR family transcriptional regulator [Serratia marcescens]AVD65824.1 LysR family transcriptional regulator [Serratia marcescens]AVN31960.1 LysR family transcriptional regulator [Serratia marcescens]AVN48545.1 LysR family transcriptional regulator [Serratia marcescens]
MKMSIKQLRAFLAVAHTLNFAQASERLNISQPALSLAIRGLEDALGGPLLLRTTRRVTLTPEGETFFPMARQLLADWDNAEEAMRQRFTLQMGKVAIAAMPSFAGNPLPPILKAFRDRYAGINVAVHDVINEQVFEMIREGRVEMGIAFEPEPSDTLHFTPLCRDRFLAVVPKDSALARKAQVSWKELLTLDFITLQRPSAVRLLLEQELARSGRTLEVAFESHQLVTVGRMVANGLGASAVPALCEQQMDELGAVCVPLIGPIIERRVGLIRLAQHQLSSAAQALATVIEREMAGSGAQPALRP